MFAKLLAYVGFASARRWDAQAMQARLAAILEYLEGADSAIEESDYAFVEGFFPPYLQSEYRKEMRLLRRKYTIIGCKLGQIECQKRMDAKETEKHLRWKEEEKQRTRGRKRLSKDYISVEKEQTPNEENETRNESEISLLLGNRTVGGDSNHD